MQLTEERIVPVPRDQVWEALTDARILQACIPGCEFVEKVSPIQFDIQVVTRLGPMNARFNGEMMLENMIPPESYSLVAVPKAGSASMAKGEAHLKLSPFDVNGRGCTRLTYTINAVIGGKMARVGSKLVDAVAIRMANHFFERFTLQITEANKTEGEIKGDVSL
jgi:carbon monoxide dehydrogenase subunit G